MVKCEKFCKISNRYGYLMIYSDPFNRFRQEPKERFGMEWRNGLVLLFNQGTCLTVREYGGIRI
jgi:hypothetical protein